MKEEEAKTKWCPHVRTLANNGGVVGVAVNRIFPQTDDNRDRCIGSDCMMWESCEYLKEVMGDCGLKSKKYNV